MIVARNDASRPAKGWYSELAHPALPFIGFRRIARAWPQLKVPDTLWRRLMLLETCATAAPAFPPREGTLK